MRYLLTESHDLISRHPWAGFLATASGFAASAASVIQMVNLAIGLIGAIFGCAAGVYTYRIQKLKYEQLKQGKLNEP